MMVWDIGLSSFSSFYLPSSSSSSSSFAPISPPLLLRCYTTSVKERPNGFQMTLSWQVVRPLISLALSICLATSRTEEEVSASVFLFSPSVCPKNILLPLAKRLFFFISPIHHVFPAPCACQFSCLFFTGIVHILTAGWHWMQKHICWESQLEQVTAVDSAP